MFDEKDHKFTINSIINKLAHQKQSCIEIVIHDSGNRNLIITKDIAQDQTIFTVNFKNTLTHTQFLSSYFAQYILFLNSSEVNNWKILGQYDSNLYLKQLVRQHSQYNMTPSIYIFEAKYLESFSTIYKTKWISTYIDCLPYQYTIPYHFSSLIKHYHQDLAHQLQNFHEEMISSYQFTKDIIYGRNVPKQFTFQNYLRSRHEEGQYLYQTYCQHFTFENYQWAFYSWKTRVFDKLSFQNNTLDYKTVFIPIIDMINHSNIHLNADWNFVQAEQVIRVKARKVLKAGDQLFINYGERSVQQFFKHYGFFTDGEQCQIKIRESSFEFIGSPNNLSLEQSLTNKLKQENFLQNMDYMARLKENIRLTHLSKSKILQKIKDHILSNNLNRQEKQILLQLQSIIQQQLKLLSKIVSLPLFNQ